jgi:hypothetical protein
MLLRSEDGVAVALDLYETPDLLATGVLLDTEMDGLSLIRDLELIVEREVWNQVENDTDTTNLSFPIEEYRLAGGEHEDLLLWMYRPDPERNAVSGRIATREENLSFVLEEFGSPEVIVVGGLIVWGLLCTVNTLRDLTKPCEKKALEVCGQGGVKSVKSKLSWRTIGCKIECQIKCFDGKAVAEDATGTLRPSVGTT